MTAPLPFPHTAASSSTFDKRCRYRLRFQKVDDLRWISHRDLARAVERWFRRAQLSLSMTGGFHPTPRINIPSALALGISGWNEVLEFELTDYEPAENVLEALRAQAPPGLVCLGLQVMPAGSAKVRVQSGCYALQLGQEHFTAAHAAVEKFKGAEPLLVPREERSLEIDLRQHLTFVSVADGMLKFGLKMNLTQGARPSEVLRGLGLSVLLEEGVEIRREDLLLAESTDAERTSQHEPDFETSPT